MVCRPYSCTLLLEIIFLFFCISLMADWPQRARLPISPTAMLLLLLLSCLGSRRIFSSLLSSPRFSHYEFLPRCKFSTLPTTRQPMCVCVFSSHSFWTSTSLDVPAGVTQEEGHTGFLIHLLSAVHALIFLARRVQPFLSLVDREVEFFVLTI